MRVAILVGLILSALANVLIILNAVLHIFNYDSMWWLLPLFVSAISLAICFGLIIYILV